MIGDHDADLVLSLIPKIPEILLERRGGEGIGL